ncbi:putative bifunctional diguanylate cyclase/phosphodiesterase [Anatilimnocola floriformis]|uniref:putative bifunctional diguanylate cyclase/phosphodiesterase n=1 Tax=Anatilimnocola floriformis TaxID=2948575 RepID=UPI0020C3F1A7|nr:EAL domain-containing response regulator [Anatilimnocola floriformis]
MTNSLENAALEAASLGKLLVVDDEEMNRDMLSRRLEIEGYEAVCADSGRTALQLLATTDFDAVLLDAMMPGMSGYEVLAEIRKTQTVLELPVLMVTAKSQSEDMVQAFESGASDYITKPINFPVALARINAHVTSRKMAVRLRESEMRYSLSAQGANDGLWDWDLLGQRVHFSDRWKSMLGYQPAEISEDSSEWFSRIHSDDLQHVRQALADHQAGLTPQFESEHRMLHRDQTYRWMLSRGMAVRDHAGRQTRMAGSQTDITRGKAADPLTGLPNRVMFMEHLAAAVKAAKAQRGAPYAVLFLDLDRFKVVNDSLGHLAGDELLVNVAKRLEGCLRRSDVLSRVSDRCTISRFGGDEFVVLLKGLQSPENASLVADRILEVLGDPLMLRGQEVNLSASIGIAVATTGDDSADDLLRDADTAMYQAKSQGKSRWCLFDQSMRKQALDRLALEADLLKAIERGEFQIHYQPIVEMPSKEIKGFEALLRWKHATRGNVSPVEFIPIAEEIGFIVDLGAWVLEHACRQVRQWQLEYPEHGQMFVSVNVSTLQFASPGLVDHVRDCLRATGLDGRCLKLEITESALMLDTELAAGRLEQLKSLGVTISLDDFGTGYSSLSYLQSFKIDNLKIDRSFIAQLGESEESNEIVRTIINLAHNLGMQVTAEGIEGQTQHTQLHQMTCESGQGYHYSRPLPNAEVVALLQQTRATTTTVATRDQRAQTVEAGALST